MFYCDSCAREKGWPETFFKSYGRCEICDKTKLCNNRPITQVAKSEIKNQNIMYKEDQLIYWRWPVSTSNDRVAYTRSKILNVYQTDQGQLLELEGFIDSLVLAKSIEILKIIKE